MKINLVEEDLRLPRKDLKISSQEAFNRLSLIAGLEDGWRGEGTKAFPRSLINKINLLIPSLPLVPLPVPSVRGAIALEWEDSRLGFLDLLLYPEGRLEVYAVSPSGEYDLEEVTCEQELLTWVSPLKKRLRLYWVYSSGADIGILTDLVAFSL